MSEARVCANCGKKLLDDEKRFCGRCQDGRRVNRQDLGKKAVGGAVGVGGVGVALWRIRPLIAQYGPKAIQLAKTLTKFVR